MSRYADEELLPSWLATRLGAGALAVLLVLAGIGLFQNAARSQPDPWNAEPVPVRAGYGGPSVPEAVAAPAEELVAATFLVVGPAAPAQAGEPPVRRQQPRQIAVLEPPAGAAEPIVVQAPPAAPAPQPVANPAPEPDPQGPSASV